MSMIFNSEQSYGDIDQSSQQPAGPTGAPRSQDPTGANGPSQPLQQPRTVPPTLEGKMGRGIFDVNCPHWISFHDWKNMLVPHILKDNEPRATGEWWVTNAIEVFPPSSKPICVVETQEQLDKLIGKAFCAMPKG